MWPNFVAVISLLCLALFAWAQAGPVPIVNEVSTQRGVWGVCVRVCVRQWSRKCKKFYEFSQFIWHNDILAQIPGN